MKVKINRLNQPKTRRGKKFLENRSPKIVENDKLALILKGSKANDTIQNILHDIRALKKPLIHHLQGKNEIRPFEDDTKLVRFSQKFDASLFLIGSTTKKHPNSLIFGRHFDHQLLDMVELNVENYKPSSDFGASCVPLGAKPSIILQGIYFQTDDVMKRLGNLMIDWFRGGATNLVRLQGLELVISLNAISDNKIAFRVYRAALKKEVASKNPRVELVEIGPRMDLVVNRNKLASEALYNKALKKPKITSKSSNKNVSHNVFGSKVAKIHTGRQNVDNIQTRKVKALKSRELK